MNYIKTYNIPFFLLAFLLLSLNLNAAEIKGKVIDAKTCETLAGANVFILGTNSGASTDKNGLFSIGKLSPGKYVIRTSFIAYYPQTDTIEIKDTGEIVEFNINLKPMIAELNEVSTTELEAYHKMILERNEESPVLSVHIDSLIYLNSELFACLSMTNNTDLPIYVLKSYFCFRVIDAIITNSDYEKINPNSILCCTGEKTCPDTTDLIKINPGEIIQYPAAQIVLYSVRSLPNGKYNVAIKYKFDAPKEISTFHCRTESNLKAMITALRGEYISDNSVVFNNIYYKKR